MLHFWVHVFWWSHILERRGLSSWPVINFKCAQNCTSSMIGKFSPTSFGLVCSGSVSHLASTLCWELQEELLPWRDLWTWAVASPCWLVGTVGSRNISGNLPYSRTASSNLTISTVYKFINISYLKVKVPLTSNSNSSWSGPKLAHGHSDVAQRGSILSNKDGNILLQPSSQKQKAMNVLLGL